MVPNRPVKKSPSSADPTPSSDGSPSDYMQYGSNKWTERLIELVLEEQALYNHMHPDYRNVARRDVIWAAIAETLLTTAEDVKRKWRSLRDTYSRIVRNRCRKGIVSDRATKKWMWSEKMEPLLAYLPTSAYGEGDMEGSGLLAMELRYEDDSGSATQDSTPDFRFSEARAHGIGENADHGEPGPSSPENGAASSTRKRPYPADGSFDQSVGYFLDEKRANVDPTDLLFLAYASAVKTFSPRRQAVTKLKIAEILMQEELNQHEDLETEKNE